MTAVLAVRHADAAADRRSRAGALARTPLHSAGRRLIDYMLMMACRDHTHTRTYTHSSLRRRPADKLARNDDKLTEA